MWILTDYLGAISLKFMSFFSQVHKFRSYFKYSLNALVKWYPGLYNSGPMIMRETTKIRNQYKNMGCVPVTVTGAGIGAGWGGGHEVTHPLRCTIGRRGDPLLDGCYISVGRMDRLVPGTEMYECLIRQSFRNTLILGRLERGTNKPMLTPHDGWLHIGLSLNSNIQPSAC